MKKISPLLVIGGLLAMGFVFTASKCETATTFPQPLLEICGDKIDNDSDGAVDCKDSECANKCQVTVTLNPPSFLSGDDTLRVSGTAQNANSITVAVRPQGDADMVPTPIGASWNTLLHHLSAPGTYTITATATGDLGSDTAVVTVTR